MPLDDVFLPAESAPVLLRPMGENKTYQRMTLRFLKVIASIQGIKPGVEEEPCPFSSPQDEAALTQSLLVLGDH